MLFSNVTTLVMATARITNPNLTHTEFNEWYNTVLLPSYMTNHNSSLGVRYKALSASAKPPTWDYVALYKNHENVATMGNNERIRQYIEPRADIGPNDVTIELTSWKPIHTFESLREKRNQVPAGRPKIGMIVKIEPREGGEEELEEWYHNQHLDMLSMLPNYRRCTRYRSLDGSKPRWLAIHEMDSTSMDPYVSEVLMNTVLTKSVMNGIKVFDAKNYEFIFEKGNLTEKL